MKRTLDTVLLLALPASGKSEVRHYLASLEPEVCAADLHLGATVQLDDYPYVHLMRRLDDELRRAGAGPAFFHSNDKPFKDARDWGTLIELLNEDHADLESRRVQKPASAAQLLFERLDAARKKVGAPAVFPALAADVRKHLADALEREARTLLDEKHAGYPDTLAGKTLVIEFARGGPHGSTMPLPAPLGYAYSLAHLSPRILERATILYVWVTPEESRRKNEARADPNDPGSILHHGVPIDVMMNDYGCDDMAHLLETSGKPGSVRIQAHGRTFDIPTARFDNRVDKTSFVRADKKDWKKSDVAALHGGLKSALEDLYRLASR